MPFPNWKPLEEKIGNHCSNFLYVGRTDHINIYKNLPTRMYLYLDDNGRCYTRGAYEFQLADFEEEWRKIAEKLGISWTSKPAPSVDSKKIEDFLMHKSVRYAMRIIAVALILRLAFETFSRWGNAFFQFDWSVAIPMVSLPLYFLLEIKWMSRRKAQDQKIRNVGLIILVLAVPFLLAILVVLGLFVGNWVPVIRELFK